MAPSRKPPRRESSQNVLLPYLQGQGAGPWLGSSEQSSGWIMGLNASSNWVLAGFKLWVLTSCIPFILTIKSQHV